MPLLSQFLQSRYNRNLAELEGQLRQDEIAALSKARTQEERDRLAAQIEAEKNWIQTQREQRINDLFAYYKNQGLDDQTAAAKASKDANEMLLAEPYQALTSAQTGTAYNREMLPRIPGLVESRVGAEKAGLGAQETEDVNKKARATGARPGQENLGAQDTTTALFQGKAGQAAAEKQYLLDKGTAQTSVDLANKQNLANADLASLSSATTAGQMPFALRTGEATGQAGLSEAVQRAGQAKYGSDVLTKRNPEAEADALNAQATSAAAKGRFLGQFPWASQDIYHAPIMATPTMPGMPPTPTSPEWYMNLMRSNRVNQIGVPPPTQSSLNFRRLGNLSLGGQ